MEQLEKVFSNKKLLEMKENLDKESQLGISQEYDRKIYDNPYKLRKTKKKFFDGKKTDIDYYTGNVLNADSNAAHRKYGRKAAQKHRGSVDHIVSLKKFHGKAKMNPFLTDADIKEIANSDFNYRVTNFHLNTQKGKKGNIEIALDPRTDVNMIGRAKLVGDQAYAETRLGIASTIATGKNVGMVFSKGALEATGGAVIPLTIASVQNLCLIAQGEKDLKAATEDMAKLTTSIIVVGGTEKVVITGVNSIMRNSGNEILKSVGTSNMVGEVVIVAYMIKDSTIRFINGEIDCAQYFSEFSQKGGELISNAIGALAGQVLIPIPMIGAFVGSLIASVACSGIYVYLQSAKATYDEERLNVISAIASEALTEMQRQRDILKTIIQAENEKWDISCNQGFEKILAGTICNDVSAISSGLSDIMNLFGKSVRFKSSSDFDKFFAKEEMTFTF